MQCIDGAKGLAGASWSQPKVKWFRNAIWLLGGIRGKPEGYCLKMRRAIKCSQCYRAFYAAAGALVKTKTTDDFAVTELEGPRQLKENSKEHTY